VTKPSKKCGIAALLACLPGLVFSPDTVAIDLHGHAKLQATSIDIPADSLLQEAGADPADDGSVELRLNLGERAGGWQWQADYQLLARQGDRLELQRQFPALDFGAAAIPDDETRLFDLTHVISEGDDRVVAHRLDRLYIGYSNPKAVIKFGRQAVSWGNGLIYNPVDFFNPFDPAAIDTEYKAGDDMLYSQYLFDSGADLQGLWVARRDEQGEVASDASSLAFKLHGFIPAGEYDLLLAEHYDARIAAIGGVFDAGGAIWRGDAMLTDNGSETFTSAVVNWSYSWVAWEHNMSGSLEYFYNGFGIDDGDYGPAALAENPELTARIRRGELFTLARDYLAATATLELTPLWQLTATLFANLDDDSRLLQLFARHDLEQNLQLLLAANLPAGDDGSEFGGIDSGIDGRPLSTGNSLFAQLAWYF
jgi:hypothetical protein